MTEETSRPSARPALVPIMPDGDSKTKLVDPSNGDNVMTFVGPGTLYLLCRRVRSWV